MFPKILFFILASTWVVGCADPKYVQISDAGAAATQSTECSAKFAQSKLCVSYTWVKRPVGNQAAEMTIKIWRPNAADGSPVLQDVNGVDVVLWMPSMGHGSSPVTVERADVGTFKATQMSFIMGGEWEIRIQIKEGNVVRDQAIIPLRI